MPEAKRLITRDLAGAAKRAAARQAAMSLDIYPPGSFQMALPGPDFMALAQHLGDGSLITSAKVKTDEGSKTVKQLQAGSELYRLYQQALRDPSFSMPIQVRAGLVKTVNFVPGHIWGQGALDYEATGKSLVDGPRRADVMIIGKMPGKSEIEAGRCLVGASGQLLVESLRNLHVKGVNKWYVTNLVKFAPPDGGQTLKAGWIADCLPLLQQELRIVQPKYILCLGADASKILLGKKFGVGYMDGRVLEYRFPLHAEATTDPEMELWHTSLVMTVVHPAQVTRAPEMRRVMERGLSRFKMLTEGTRFDVCETGLDHRTIQTIEELRSLLYEIDNDPFKRDRWISVDAEWHGEHPVNAGSYLRTVQLGWKPQHAACIMWSNAGGSPGLLNEYGEDGRPEAVKLINAFFANKRVCGHFLVADLEWLVYAGMTMIRDRFFVPLYDKLFDQFQPGAQAKLRQIGFNPGDTVPAYFRTMFEGGWDTGLAAHAIEETAQLGLEVLLMRYTTCPRYDIPLENWKTEYCKKLGIKPKDLEGYGDVDDSVLIPYACLHGESRVQLADGSWEKIGKLVKRRYRGCVKSFVNGSVVNSRVTGWHRNSVGQKAWFKIKTGSSQSGRFGLLGPAFTPDHKVLTCRGKVEIENLVVGADAVLTDELEFSSEQLSVFLGSLLGDGGFTRKNDVRVGFGFGQCRERAAYADWKAEIFSTHSPTPVSTRNGDRRYTIPFSRYLTELSKRFPVQPVSVHGKRKAVINHELLSVLDDLGVAVWYQDDGTLVKPHGGVQFSSRIYCHISSAEQSLVVSWLIAKYGLGVSYNKRGHFIQITKEAFENFHAAIHAFIHPVMAYKTIQPVSSITFRCFKHDVKPFYDVVTEIVPYKPRPSSRGNGVRYCLTVENAGNFLTQAGFVSNCYDADGTLRLMYEQIPLIDADYEENCCREPFWESMITVPVILEMHQEGLPVDRPRIDYLTNVFMSARAGQEEQIQGWAKWPEFNIRSVQHVREFLFGTKYNGKKDKLGNDIQIGPPGRVSLGLEPILDTSKPPKRWWELKERGVEAEHNASTGKTVLGVLANDNPAQFTQIQWVRDFRFVDQVLKSVLRPPKVDDHGNPVYEVDDKSPDASSGESVADVTTAMGVIAAATDNLAGLVYEAGLASVICDDGKVRTHLYPTTETGRWRSARPALQNISKRRDDDYKRILGKDVYKYKIRSVLCTEPGSVLVEADLKSAELFCMAIMSGDPALLEHCRRNQLDEHDPNYYDIHSNIAVTSFGLACAPTKDGLKLIGKVGLRVAAKNVIFGMAYGRGAKAIALQCREEGNPISPEEAQRIIDAVFAMYPGLVPFFASCKARVHDPRWLATCFGRLRRFPFTKDEMLLGEFERQAMNCPIQSMVASAVDRGLAYLRDYRDRVLKDPNFFRFKLQIHDAGLFSVPYANVDYFVNTMLPLNMCRRVPIYPTSMDGVPLNAGPYYLGIDVEVYTHWGEALTSEFCQSVGLDVRYAKH